MTVVFCFTSFHQKTQSMTDIMFSNSAINKIADAGLNGLLQKAGFEKDREFDCVMKSKRTEAQEGGLIADEMESGRPPGC